VPHCTALLVFGIWTQSAAARCPCCGHALSTATWLAIGFAGQALFTARFLVQWIASERKRDSVVPVAFWWFSLMGGTTLLCYAISRSDPVIIVGQAMGIFIYIRNLMLFKKGQRRALKERRRSAAAQQALHHKDGAGTQAAKAV